MASLLSMLVTEAKSAIYARGLAVAAWLGINTTSWAPGDPTRSLYWYLAEVLSALEVIVAGYVSSGFLDYAADDWLTILAKQVFNVDRVLATYAGTPVTLTNSAGGLFTIAAGDVMVKNSINGATYTNTSGGTLASGSVGSPTTLTLDFTADVAGASGSSAAGGIDTLVTGMLGVACSNAAAALGLDAELDEPLRERCRAKLGMLSPNGPADAYNFVVRSSALTGVTDITRSRTIADSTTGDVTVYVAGPSGAVAGASVTAAQAAVLQYATPQCVTPTVVNCTALAVIVIADVWVYASVGQTAAAIQTQIAADLVTMFAARPIGGDIIPPATTGSLYQSLIAGTIRGSFAADTFRVSMTSPSGDTAMAINQVAELSGTPTINVHLETNP